MRKEEMRRLLEEETLLSENEIKDILKIGVWTNDIDEFIKGCEINGFFDESEDAEADKESMKNAYEGEDWDSGWGVSTNTILVKGWIINK